MNCLVQDEKTPGNGVIVVFVTCPPTEALVLGRALVVEGLAACVNIVPSITSVYVWKDNVCQDSESLLVLKTTREMFARLSERIKSLHSYEVPEIIAIPVEAGWQPYIDWVRSSCACLPVPETQGGGSSLG